MDLTRYKVTWKSLLFNREHRKLTQKELPAGYGEVIYDRMQNLKNGKLSFWYFQSNIYLKNHKVCKQIKKYYYIIVNISEHMTQTKQVYVIFY